MGAIERVPEPPPFHVERTIDTRGLLCPYPFIEAKQALDAARPGSAVEILTDSEATAVSSIPILCQRQGYEVVTTRDGGLWRLVVRKP